MDVFGIINLGFTTIFANGVVLGVAVTNVLLVAGSIFILINNKQGKVFIFDGFVLGVIIAILSSTQFHIIPLTFAAVRDLGIPTFPESEFTRMWDYGLYWLSYLPVIIGAFAGAGGALLGLCGFREWFVKGLVIMVCFWLMCMIFTGGKLFVIVSWIFGGIVIE